MKSPKVSFRIPVEELSKIDKLIQGKLFEDRTAFFRKASKQLLEHYAEYEASVRKGA